MELSLKEILTNDPQAQAIALKQSSRMNWRRDMLTHYFRTNKIKCNFSMAELKALVLELQKEELIPSN